MRKMFDLDKQDINSCPSLKKRKVEQCSFNPVHSSLDYSSFKAPPLVEYKSIDAYCENKPGKSSLPCFDQSNNVPSTSGIKNLQNISNPIVFKSPRSISVKRSQPVNVPKPYCFFSIEELSLVKSLENWMNSKVCAIGISCLDPSTQQCYLNSVMETGSWQLLLDTSFLPEIPVVQKVLQYFGVLEVINEVPRLKVHFCRNLDSVDIPIFIQSYKLMEKYVPEFIKISKTEETGYPEEDKTECLLNDTLDEYNFSLIM